MRSWPEPRALLSVRHNCAYFHSFPGSKIMAIAKINNRCYSIESPGCFYSNPFMVKITAEYEGQLHCQVIHGPSGSQLNTDAPVDNNGRGESFSPTDLCATAFATCMATIMGIQAEKIGVDLKGMKVEVTKEMSSDKPRRIVRLPVEFWVPGKLTEEHKAALIHAAETCPVHYSLNPDIDKPICFHWVDED